MSFLIGTDILGRLGFQLLHGHGSKQEDLLTGNQIEPRITNPEPTGNNVEEEVVTPNPDNMPDCKERLPTW